MANLQVLKDEIDADPLGRGYSGMDDAAVAADLNTVYRERNKTSVSGDEIFNAADPSEYAGLLVPDKQLFLAICGRDSIDPFGANNVQAMVSIFGGGSTTIANLQALRVESITRWEELGFYRPPTAPEVADARAAP